MGFSNALRTIGVCIGHPWEPQVFPPPPRNRILTPTLVQRNLIEQMARGIRMACDIEDLRLLLYPYSTYRGATPEDVREDNLSGLILVSGFVDPVPEPLAEAGVPVLLLNRFRDVPIGFGSVFSVEGHTISTALSHLWNLGHRRIAYVAGPMGGSPAEVSRRRSRQSMTASDLMREMRASASDTAVRRMERYITWMETRRAFDPELVATTYEWQDRTLMRALLVEWALLPNGPTAIFCGHEGAAVNLLASAQAQGIRVPEELSIIGVDTEAGLMSLTHPPLTCVELPAELMGFEAVRTLLRQIRQEGASGEEMPNAFQVAIPVVRLREGATTAPPPRQPLDLRGRV
ncbi:MAG: substrate-binding domain-containing protein [Capsulimonadales bacterium]|nr:substrate-binding domain-containing protein [Capsulimonadales bacterium]